jgi:TetR/AcrR family transcriptional regulator, regulator of cefoperazone and chloramphenicol sensitivity
MQEGSAMTQDPDSRSTPFPPVDWRSIGLYQRPPRRSHRGDKTRHAIMEAAGDLMAEHGPDAVSLRAILEQAGVSNESAIHYHFGSREGLIVAILSERSPLEAARAKMLAEATRDGRRPGVREAVGLVASPVAASMATRKDRNYIRIAAHVIRNLAPIDRRRPDEPTLVAALDLLSDALVDITEPVRTARVVAAITLTAELWAARAAEIDRGIDHILDDATFASNIVDMLVGLVTAPMTPLS